MTECEQILVYDMQNCLAKRDKLCSKAMDPNTPPEELSMLARHQVYSVRWSVIYNEHTPSDALTELIKMGDDLGWTQREELLSHPNTHPLVKVWLQSDYRNSISLKEFLEAAQ